MEITLIFCEHCYDFILEEEALYLEELPYCIECVDAVSSNTN
jgi:formylmethanofuran dehydrogenase subunit E